MDEEIKAALMELFPSAEFEVRLDGDEVRVSWWAGALVLEKVEACVARVSGYELKENVTGALWRVWDTSHPRDQHLLLEIAGRQSEAQAKPTSWR